MLRNNWVVEETDNITTLERLFETDTIQKIIIQPLNDSCLITFNYYDKYNQPSISFDIIDIAIYNMPNEIHDILDFILSECQRFLDQNNHTFVTHSSVVTTNLDLPETTVAPYTPTENSGAHVVGYSNLFQANRPTTRTLAELVKSMHMRSGPNANQVTYYTFNENNYIELGMALNKLLGNNYISGTINIDINGEIKSAMANIITLEQNVIVYAQMDPMFKRFMV